MADDKLSDREQCARMAVLSFNTGKMDQAVAWTIAGWLAAIHKALEGLRQDRWSQ